MGKYVYILNFGNYFSRLTAKQIKNIGGYPRIVTFNTPYSDLKNPAGFIISGAPNGSIRIPVKLLSKDLFASNCPVLGVCVGAHLVTRYFGGEYKYLKRQAESGMVTLRPDRRNKILCGLKKYEEVVMMHDDSIVSPGEGFIVTAHTDRCMIAATAHKRWRWYTVQFHPELSDCGRIIFKNFLNLCYYDQSADKPEKRNIRLYVGEKKGISSLPNRLNNSNSKKAKTKNSGFSAMIKRLIKL